MIAIHPDRIRIPAAHWAGFKFLGITPTDVARHLRLPVTMLAEHVTVTTAQYFALWQAASDLTHDLAAGIKLATHLDAGVMPPAFIAAYHARDFGDALRRVARFKQLCAPEVMHVSHEGNSCRIELEWGYGGEQTQPPALVDATMAALMELGRRGTGEPLKARLVELARPKGSAKAHEVYFGCRIRLGAERNSLHLHRDDLDRLFVSYNAELLEMLAPQLDRALDEQQRAYTFTDKVKWSLKRRLAGGQPDIRAVAKEMCVSERTLQRRIGDEGATFQHLLAAARHELAQDHLANPALEIKEVAFLLGYEDQNSFYRAFRLWEGVTPSHWRSARLATGDTGAPDRGLPARHQRRR